MGRWPNKQSRQVSARKKSDRVATDERTGIQRRSSRPRRRTHRSRERPGRVHATYTHTHTHARTYVYIYIYTRVQSLYRGDGGEETRTTHTENRATHAGAESSGGAARNLLSLIFVMTLFDWCLSLADGRKITHWKSQSFII